jgi:N-methylhydantoinase B
MPDKLAGDMQAQIAACRSAEKSFQKLVERYGSATLRQILASLHDYAERMMRAEIAALPDGTWSFTDYLDGTGTRPEPIALKVTVTIAADELTVDWTGSAPQLPAAINCPSPFVKSAVHLIMKCLAREDIPNFEGYTRPFRIILPEGTIVNPTAPAACAARAIIGWRAIDTLLGAFAQIVPSRVPAAGEGGVAFPAISGFQQGRRFVCSETLAGSWGGMADRDGVFGIPNAGGNVTNQPVEMIEAQFPIRIVARPLTFAHTGCWPKRPWSSCGPIAAITCPMGSTAERRERRHGICSTPGLRSRPSRSCRWSLW